MSVVLMAFSGTGYESSILYTVLEHTVRVFLSLVAILTTLVEEDLRFHSRGALLVQGVLLESPV
jgi:hypothetical protein